MNGSGAHQATRLPAHAPRLAGARFLAATFAAALLGVFLPSLARAQAAIAAPEITFTPADSGRAWMDAGGTWDGTTLTDHGDTFTVKWTNTGDQPAYNFTLPAITLPANFDYRTTGGAMSLTYTGTGTPPTGVTASQAGQTLTPALTPATPYTLDPGASIMLTYRVQAAVSVGTGSYSISYGAAQWTDTEEVDPPPPVQSAATATQAVEVRNGATSMTISPVQQTKAVGQNAVFTVTIENTGNGGLFEVSIDDSAVNALQNLAFVSIAKTSPATPNATAGMQKLTLPYLKPGEKFIADITATVLACGTITNTVTSTNRTGAVFSVSASVQIDLQVPLVQYTPPTVQLHYDNGADVTIPITNTGLGNAKVFRLKTTLNTSSLLVENIASGWTYNAGTFTYNDNSGTIAKEGGSATLSFTLKSSDPCTVNAVRMIEYVALYTNDCGDEYFIPVRDQIVNPPTDLPALSFTKTVSGTGGGLDGSRLAVADQGIYTLTLSAANITNITSTEVTVTDTLPTQIEYLSHTASTGAAGLAGSTLTWTVPVSDLNTPRTLTINFAVKNDPCLAGQVVPNAANTSVVTTNRGCTLQETAAVSFLITSNPLTTANQYLRALGSPSGGFYETGNPDAGAFGTREAGEGEFIPLQSTFVFGAAYPGTWAGSIYNDNFGGLSQMSLAKNGVIQYRWRVGEGAWSGLIDVPGASITPGSPGFNIDLGFLEAATGSANVADISIEFTYSVTVTDAAVPGTDPSSVMHVATLVLANATGATGCASGVQSRFTQGVFYSIGRAVATIAIAPSASINALEVCKDELFTITVANASSKQARDILVTLLNNATDYIYDTGFTPVYGGDFNSGNITYDPKGGSNPTFTYNGGAPLTQNSTIQVRLRRKETGDVTPRAISARVNYDSWDTAVDASPDRAYDATGVWTPYAIRKANLAVTVTPGQITVTGTSAEYSVWVLNTDAGTAWGAQLSNTLPLGIVVDEAATNGFNSAPMNVVAVSGGDGVTTRQTLTWSLGNLTPGQSVQVRLKINIVEVGACAISVNPATDVITAIWGCDGAAITDTGSRVSPNYVFPTGQMTIAHDASTSILKLCETGTIALVFKNTGPTFLKDASVQDVIPDYLSIAGQVQYKIGSGALTDITGATTVVNAPAGKKTLTWTSANIGALAGLAAGSDEIRIYVPVIATEALASSTPQFSASASAKLVCGTPVASNTQVLNPAVQRPAFTVTKTGRNVTANPAPAAPFARTVYGGAGDEIEWQVTIKNTGNATAAFIQIQDQLLKFNAGAGTTTISGPGITGTVPIGGNDSFALDAAFTMNPNDTATYSIKGVLVQDCSDVTSSVSVTWACTSAGPRISTPGSPTDSASLKMIPLIGNPEVTQTIEYLNGGRAKITATVVNRGGNAYHFVITNTFPNANMVLDETVSPAVAVVHDRAPWSPYPGAPIEKVNSVTVDNTTPTAPKFTLVGSGGSPITGTHIIRYGDRVTLTYYVRPTVFDTQYATTFPGLAQQDSTNSRDPAYPASGNNAVKVDYQNGCTSPGSPATNTANIDLRSPNLDITAASSENNLLTANSTANYSFTVANVGEAGSVAEHIVLNLTIGSGWTVNSFTIGGASATATTTTPGVGTTEYSFVLTGVTLAQGASRIISANLTYNETTSSGPLTLRLEAIGQSRGENQSDTTVFGNYSRDWRAQRAIGVSLTKELIATSEPDSLNSYVLNGEDLTYRITVNFRGGENDVTNIAVVEQLRHGATAGTNGNNFGFVSFTPVSGVHNTGAVTTTTVNDQGGSLAVKSAFMKFTVPTLSSGAMTSGGGAVFQGDLVARVMNISGNANNNARTTYTGLQFTYQGVTFYNNSAAFTGGLSGTVSDPNFLKTNAVTVLRPGLTITKLVRNVTRDALIGPNTRNFAANVDGEAGDVIEYKIVVTNNASNSSPADQRRLYDLSVTDTLPAGFKLSTGNAGLAFNTAPFTLRANTIGLTEGAGTITFTHANTPGADTDRNLDVLGPGSGRTIALLYRGTLENSVAPGQVLTNSAKVVGYSVPIGGDGKSENQTGTKGTPAENNAAATADAPRTYAVTVATPATVTIDPVKPVATLKSIITTSVGSDTSTTVQIGEQIRYEIGLIVPRGTVPKLQVYDQLPAGLGLIGLEEVTFGSAFDSNAQPTTTPLAGALPASGSPLNITWNFGSRLVNEGTEAQRTVTIRYVAQVRNVSTNQQGTQLTNTAQFSTAAEPPTAARDSIGSVTVTIAEPQMTLGRQVRNVTRGGSFAATATADAGDILEYQVTLANANGANVSPAYDLNFVDQLPLGVTYVGASPGTGDADSTAVVSSTNLTGTLVAPDIVAATPTEGQKLTWGRTQGSPADLDLAGNGTLTFKYQVKVDDTSRPSQVYAGTIAADWTSLDGDTTTVISPYTLNAPGDALGERTGVVSDALNDYRATIANTVTALNSTTVAKIKEGDTLPRTVNDSAGPSPSGFRIGDIITYTVTATVQEGTLKDFQVKDTLPAGLAFIETVSINGAAVDAAAVAPLDYNALVVGSTAPAANATGAIAWTFANDDGNLVNAGDNDTDNGRIVIVYRARVLNGATGTDPATTPVAAPTNAATSAVARNNSATAAYKLANDTNTATAAAVAGVSVNQPWLTLARVALDPNPALCTPNVLRPGETGEFKLTVTNGGNAPAYNAILTETLPALMRATPINVSIRLNGALFDAGTFAAAYTYDGPTGKMTVTLGDTQPILPGNTLELTYTFTVDASAPKGTTLTPIVGLVTEHYSLPSGISDPPGATHRRQYAPVSTTDNSIIVGLEIKGFVYNDIEPNGHRDGFENWNTGPMVYVNLVNSANQVCRSTIVAANALGDYKLERVAPGSYTIIVTNSPTSVTATAPAGWIFRMPVDGRRPVTTTIVDLLEENFGLYQGTGAITGTVFKDIGGSGATGNNGIKESAEPGIPGVTVRLLKGGTELATAVTDGSGKFTLYVPTSGVASGDALIIEQTNLSGYLSTGATTQGGTYDRATDRITFTYNPTGALTGFAFGDVPVNQLLTDGAQSILPGSMAIYKHTFIAGTSGTVTFTLTGAATPADVPWTQVVLADPGTGSPLDGQAIPVVAGQEYQLIVRQNSPAGAPMGAINTATLKATFVYGNGLPNGELTRQDVTTIGLAASAGLQLVKEVDKATALPGTEIEYTISYTNAGAGPLTELFIMDSTPAYTVFVSAAYEMPLPASITAVTVDAPAANATGSIKWTFTGSLAAGASGKVTFKIKVSGN